ncbi:MAG: hypothetical protein M3O36_09895, partial [Myxococcota bacterium]|nr:hypothetical protein [Myxococcota bacterium]
APRIWLEFPVRMAEKTNAKKRDKRRPRCERRFEPLARSSPALVYALGGAGAMLMGAGAWGQFGVLVREEALAPFPFAAYLLAGGAALVGIAVWIGTSGEPAVRVGDAGIAVEKGGVHRIPWYAVESIVWREQAVRVLGKDDLGAAMNVVVSLASQPQAGAWIVKEARERVPAVVDVPADATLPLARAAGEVLPLEPPQVVGRHCAASGKVIAYEPDARVCERCERVYQKDHVPDVCACGASLAALLRARTA